MSSIKYFDKKVYPGYDASFRFRRAVRGRNDTWKNNVSFHVCCDHDEYLDSKFECVKVNVTKEDRDIVISETAVVDEDLIQSSINLDRVLLEYKFKGICPKEEMQRKLY